VVSASQLPYFSNIEDDALSCYLTNAEARKTF
jgi:hypothetical protein